MLHVMKSVLAYGLLFGLGTAGVIWARVAALRPDPEAERILNSPGVIEKALARARENAAETRQDKPPLVAAEALALYLNPPEPPTAKRPPPRPRAAPPKPAPVDGKGVRYLFFAGKKGTALLQSSRRNS